MNKDNTASTAKSVLFPDSAALALAAYKTLGADFVGFVAAAMAISAKEIGMPYESAEAIAEASADTLVKLSSDLDNLASAIELYAESKNCDPYCIAVANKAEDIGLRIMLLSTIAAA